MHRLEYTLTQLSEYMSQLSVIMYRGSEQEVPNIFRSVFGNFDNTRLRGILTHWILDIFSAAVSHGLSILGTKRKFGGHILKLRFLI